MHCHFAFLFIIGLIATCTGEDSQLSPDKPNPDKPNPDKPVEDSSPAAAADAAPTPADVAPVAGKGKNCKDKVPNKVSKVWNDTPNLACRNGNIGLETCQEICSDLGFKLGQCKNAGNRPSDNNNANSCVCSHDGKHGIVAREYEGPQSLRRKKGYFDNFFPMRGACNDCSCYKGCEDNSSKMSRDDKVVSAGGQCVDDTCVCLRAWLPTSEKKLAKRRFAHFNRHKSSRRQY